MHWQRRCEQATRLIKYTSISTLFPDNTASRAASLDQIMFEADQLHHHVLNLSTKNALYNTLVLFRDAS